MGPKAARLSEVFLLGVDVGGREGVAIALFLTSRITVPLGTLRLASISDKYVRSTPAAL